MSTPSSTQTDDAPRPGDPPARSRASVWTWLLLLLLLAALPPAWLAIYATVKPTYKATAVVRMEPRRPGLPSAEPVDERSLTQYINTHIPFLKSNMVLERVMADPAVASLPPLRDAPDRLEALRAALKASRREGTALVDVAFEADDPQAAAETVNAVADSFMRAHRELEEMRRERDRKLRDDALNRLEMLLHSKVRELIQHVDGGKADLPDREKDGPTPPTAFRMESDAYFDKIAERLAQVDADLIEAEAQPHPDETRRTRIETLKGIQAGLRQTFSNRGPKPTESDRVAESLLRLEIDDLSRRRADLRRQIEDVEFADSRGFTGVELQDRASAPDRPTSDPRLAYAILTSIVLTFLLGGAALFGVPKRRGVEPPAPAGAGPSPNP